VDDRRGRLATRLFVYGFLAVFLYAGAAGVEAWPLTGWKLFSRVRTDHQAGWEAVTVDGAGGERPVIFAALPRGYRGGPHLFDAFRRLSPARIESACRALVAAVRKSRGGDVRFLRVYRSARRLSLAGGGRPVVALGPRLLLYECARAPERRG